MKTRLTFAAVLIALAAGAETAKAPRFFYSCPELQPPGVLPKDPTHAAMFCVKFEEICRAKGIQCEKAPRAALLKALVD